MDMQHDRMWHQGVKRGLDGGAKRACHVAGRYRHVLIAVSESRTRAGERDREQQDGETDAEPQMNLDPDPAQPKVCRRRHRALFVIVPSNLGSQAVYTC